jgi:hypothetical protein
MLSILFLKIYLYKEGFGILFTYSFKNDLSLFIFSLMKEAKMYREREAFQTAKSPLKNH